MQICPQCFDDMKMIEKPKLNFACDCGYKDESWIQTNNINTDNAKKIVTNSLYGKSITSK